LLFGALAFAGTSAFAVDIDSDFDDLDTNRDGVVSADETRDEALLSQYWYKYDENNDGALDTVEFSAFQDADIDDLEPYVLRHDWYGSTGILDQGSGY
jgi:hypothetical protein